MKGRTVRDMLETALDAVQLILSLVTVVLLVKIKQDKEV
jgi:hypothetical protein|nr:MAG TPA: hypothetical protein [Caudoviricetes sp.]